MEAATHPPATGDIDLNTLPYEFKVLAISDLFVDDSYQRPLTSFVDRIEQHFDPALLGCLVVSARDDGSNAVVDGQTRMEGARRRGVESLPCVVFSGLTQADEANLFYRLQRERRNMTSFTRFRAALVAGDEEAVAINRIANAAGYEVGWQKNTHITAVAGLENVFRRSPEMLERTLIILREAWGDRHMPSGEILRGMGYFLTKDDKVDDEKLAKKLSLVTPDALSRRASALREGGGGGSGAVRYMAGAIEGVYKKKA